MHKVIGNTIGSAFASSSTPGIPGDIVGAPSFDDVTAPDLGAIAPIANPGSLPAGAQPLVAGLTGEANVQGPGTIKQDGNPGGTLQINSTSQLSYVDYGDVSANQIYRIYYNTVTANYLGTYPVIANGIPTTLSDGSTVEYDPPNIPTDPIAAWFAQTAISNVYTPFITSGDIPMSSYVGFDSPSAGYTHNVTNGELVGDGFMIATAGFGIPEVAAAESASTIDTLSAAANRAAATVGPGSGPVYGTAVHSAFQVEVDALGNANLATEQSYLNGEIVDYGTPGSVRLDVVEGPLDNPSTVYDLKTGSATLTPSRILQIQSHLPPSAGTVPVYEVRP